MPCLGLRLTSTITFLGFSLGAWGAEGRHVDGLVCAVIALGEGRVAFASSVALVIQQALLSALGRLAQLFWRQVSLDWISALLTLLSGDSAGSFRGGHESLPLFLS